MKKKIIISAYACSPNTVSEPLVAFNYIETLLKRNEYYIFLLTRKKNCKAINDFMINKNYQGRIKVFGIDLPKILSFWKVGHLSMNLYYTLWQIRAFFVAKKICSNESILLVHHLSFMSCKINMSPFLEIPSIVGPVGGMQRTPANFTFFNYPSIKILFREFIITCTEASFLWRHFIQKIDLLLLANHKNIESMPPGVNFKVKQIGWALSKSVTNPIKDNPKKDCIIIYWGGRMEAWKGLGLLLNAINNVKAYNKSFKLHITGSGPELRKYQKFTKLHNLESIVIFHGWVNAEKKRSIQDSSDIFIFSSLHETTGTIIFEMMEKSKAIIAFNYAGPSEILHENCALLIDIETPSSIEKITAKLSKSILLLLEDNYLRIKLGKNARNHLIKNHSLEAHVDYMCSQYKIISEAYKVKNENK